MVYDKQTPHDRLMAVIGILQVHYLAGNSMLNADAVFGKNHLPDAGLEHAIKILIDLLPVVEDAPEASA